MNSNGKFTMLFISTTSAGSVSNPTSELAAGNEIHVPAKTNGVPLGTRTASRYSACTRYTPLYCYIVSALLYRTSAVIRPADRLGLEDRVGQPVARRSSPSRGYVSRKRVPAEPLTHTESLERSCYL